MALVTLAITFSPSSLPIEGENRWCNEHFEMATLQQCLRFEFFLLVPFLSTFFKFHVSELLFSCSWVDHHSSIALTITFDAHFTVSRVHKILRDNSNVYEFRFIIALHF
jgi:hypothetical protein